MTPAIIQQRALELKIQGLTFTEIMRELGLPSRSSAAGHVHRAKLRLTGHHPRPRHPPKYTYQIWFWDTPEVLGKLDAIAAEWQCSRSEVLRTFIACSLEDYYAEE